MSKKNYTVGHASVNEFFAFINERHRIYCKRAEGRPKPWTDDEILQQFKFTNVFRQLDRGTIALHEYILKQRPEVYNAPRLEMMDLDDACDMLWQILWYRYFNMDVHAKALGWTTQEKLHEYLCLMVESNRKVFTSAWMATGVTSGGIPKHLTYLRCCEDSRPLLPEIVGTAYHTKSMEQTWKSVMRLPLVGKFVAYEIVCDMRFTPLLRDAKDVLTWANVGPGARRGMERLGMEPSVQSMRDLYEMAPQFLEPHVLNASVPFELREIEQCLCEFDKYQRVKMGTGRPREKYNGGLP